MIDCNGQSFIKGDYLKTFWIEDDGTRVEIVGVVQEVHVNMVVVDFSIWDITTDYDYSSGYEENDPKKLELISDDTARKMIIKRNLKEVK